MRNAVVGVGVDHGGVERRAQVVTSGVNASCGSELVTAIEIVAEPLRQLGVVMSVTGGHELALATLGQQVVGVLADRFEQPEPARSRAVGGDHRPVHEGGEHRRCVGGHGRDSDHVLGGVEVEVVGEDAEAGEHAALFVVQEVVAPIERRAQRAVVGDSIPLARHVEVDALR